MAEVDIIDLWNKGKKHATKGEELNIDELVTKRSKTPLYWIKVVLWIEFWMNLLSFPIVYVFYKEDEPILYGVVMPLIILIYLVYYQFLIRQIKAFDFSVDVKTGIKKLYGYLNFFFLHYKVVVWVIIPLAYIYGNYVAFQENPTEFTLKSGLIMLVTGIIICGAIVLLSNFLINLIYGRKIKRLRGIVAELVEEDHP